tara:strand:+ start:443 stop:925 length:483 start_codon:yes stop_codon:yes gene_type:complete
MTNFEEINNLVQDECDKVNNKLRGINYLESLKYTLVPRIALIADSFKEMNHLKNYKNSIKDQNDNEFEIEVLVNTKEKLINKKKEVEKNTLFIVLKGFLGVDIFNKQLDKYTKLSIYPLMGVCISNSSIINLNIYENSIYIKLSINDLNINIEKNDKDAI